MLSLTASIDSKSLGIIAFCSSFLLSLDYVLLLQRKYNIWICHMIRVRIIRFGLHGLIVTCRALRIDLGSESNALDVTRRLLTHTGRHV